MGSIILSDTNDSRRKQGVCLLDFHEKKSVVIFQKLIPVKYTGNVLKQPINSWLVQDFMSKSCVCKGKVYSYFSVSGKTCKY